MEPAGPVTNRIVTGDWIFKTWASGNYNVAMTDSLWLLAGILPLAVKFVMKWQKEVMSSKHPSAVSVS